eukprot:352473-Chlamydomonas_euryale.AAC.16
MHGRHGAACLASAAAAETRLTPRACQSCQTIASTRCTGVADLAWDGVRGGPEGQIFRMGCSLAGRRGRRAGADEKEVWTRHTISPSPFSSSSQTRFEMAMKAMSMKGKEMNMKGALLHACMLSPGAAPFLQLTLVKSCDSINLMASACTKQQRCVLRWFRRHIVLLPAMEKWWSGLEPCAAQIDLQPDVTMLCCFVRRHPIMRYVAGLKPATAVRARAASRTPLRVRANAEQYGVFRLSYDVSKE